MYIFAPVMETIKNRRSIRKYSNKDVPQELLDEILTLSERTQTMGNLQLYSVVVTRSDEKKRELAPAHFNQPMVMGAPVVLTICADYNRTTRWCEERNATPGYGNLLSFMNAASDALLYTQTLCTVAEARGLGICYLGTTLYNSGQIVDILKLPRLVVPVATITLGYPDETPEQTDRLPLSAIVHNEEYCDYSSERIDAEYSYKESLEESKHFVEINNKETLAQIFTDIRYTKKDCEAFSAALMKTLKKQGFVE